MRALAFDPSFRFLFALGLASTSAACVLDWASIRSDGGVAPTEDAADTGEDVGSGDGEPGDGGDEKLPCKEESLVINEVQTGGPGGTADEFVEIHNPTSCDFKLEGYTLRYSSSNGSSPFAVWTGSAADGIGPGTYVVVGGTGFPGMALGRFASSQLAAGGGGIGLFNPGSKVIDSVAYGTVDAGNPLVRPPGGKAAPAPASGQSIARTPDGKDTETNEADFAITSTPTPNEKN
ncbi:MAG: Endonuclease/exonuclease/phosphatase [Myxococcaceae bacterium]|nr:Endonuclease/exonuclease/phosphatase [Myxococcaceae bacterium]